MTDFTTLNAFETLHDGQNWDVTVDDTSGWIHVYDVGTSYLLDGNDERNLEAMRTYIAACEAAYATGERERLADAYVDFCDSTPAKHAADAPPHVVSKFAELLGREPEHLTGGW